LELTSASALTPALSSPSSLCFDAIAPEQKAKADRRGRINRQVLCFEIRRFFGCFFGLFIVKSTVSADAARTDKILNVTTLLSLSLGERAGVRASVTSIVHGCNMAQTRRSVV